MLELVAERGFRGTSMAAVAQEAGVAAGTAYVHYDSKDDLIVAAYLELKSELAAAALAGVEPGDPPEAQFHRVWRNVHAHLSADPARARYLSQVEASPYIRRAHELAAERGDPLVEASRHMARYTVDLPAMLVWDLAFGPAIRLAADTEIELEDSELEVLARACWRAVSKVS